jgi:uncharacterized membrane protein
MTDLDPTYSFSASSALAVNADGSVVIGSIADRLLGTQAMYWTAATGITELPMLTGAGSMIANAIDGDGKIIVGTAATDPNDQFVPPEGRTDLNGNGVTVPIRWTAATGTQNLVTLLAAAGVDMTGQTLLSANGITRDGQFISGNEIVAGENDGDPEPYVARYCDATNADACTSDGGGGGPIGGMTTQQSLETSLGQVGNEYQTVSAQLGGTAGLLLGALQPIEGGDGYGVFSSVGSFTLGAKGRYNVGDGFSVLGGAAFVSQEAGGASVSGAALFGAAVRYVSPIPLSGTALRPYAEGGAWGSPNLSMHFTRTYVNGAGTATGEGDTTGSAFGLYGTAGLLYAPTPDDELAFSATLARDWLSTAAYAEATSASNPFPASFAAASASATEIKATAQWTHHLDANLDLTLSGSVGHSFGAAGSATATIPGFGSLTGSAGDYSFGQLGARLEYKVKDNITLDAFALSTFGDHIGTHTQFGGALNVAF